MGSAEAVLHRKDHRKPRHDEVAHYVSHARHIANEFIRRKRYQTNHDDIQADAMQALVEAWHRYNPEKQACFKTYSEHFIKGTLLRWQDNHIKYHILFSVTDPLPSDDTSLFETQISDSEVCEDPFTISQRDQVVSLLAKARIRAGLNKTESAVVDLWVEGMSFSEISTELEITSGSANRLLTKALNKLRDALVDSHKRNVSSVR